MSSRTRQVVLVISLFCINQVTATVYRCIDDEGTIHYQSRECAEDTSESVLNVSDEPEEVVAPPKKETIVEPVKRVKPMSAEQQAQNRQKLEALKAQCKSLNKSLRAEERRIVAQCKKDRDIYCDEGAEAIEQKNLKRDIKNTYSYVPQDGKPQLYLPKLFRIKKEMQELGCRN